MSIKKKSAEKEAEEKPQIKERYFEAVGRRKTAVARVWLFSGKTTLEVNKKSFKDYFQLPSQQLVVESPLVLVGVKDKLGALVRVKGSGLSAQAEAVRHGLARALVKYNEEFRGRLRQAGFLTRDARMVERKKYGLKKARRAPQWSKR